MLDTIRKWQRRRVLAQAAIPEALWREALEALPFMAIYTDTELGQLRELVVLYSCRRKTWSRRTGSS